MKFAAALSALLLAGCAGTQGQLDLLEHQGALSITPADAPGYNYVVSIKRGSDFQYGTADKATREEIALRYVAHQCASASVVGDDALDMGETAVGAKRATYFIRIKCN